MCLPKKASAGELFLYQMIAADHPDAVRGHRVGGLEIDVYVPSRRVGFEFNGLFWHRETGVGRDYHLRKSQVMHDHGIRLYHVWEDELDRIDVLRSRISNALGRSGGGHGARRTKVRGISSREAAAFCDLHHLQGGVTSSVAYGAFLGDELVSVMSFGRPRFAGDCDLELLRLCSSRPVPGVAGKLFSAFRKDHPSERVVSYADRAWTFDPDGSVYGKIGFRFDGVTPPSYWYVVRGKRVNRMRLTKKRLMSMGGTGSTELEMAASLGIYRVYNLGNLRFVSDGTSTK